MYTIPSLPPNSPNRATSVLDNWCREEHYPSLKPKEMMESLNLRQKNVQLLIFVAAGELCSVKGRRLSYQ